MGKNLRETIVSKRRAYVLRIHNSTDFFNIHKYFRLRNPWDICEHMIEAMEELYG